jgi:type I restriction enzyme S subunit
MLEGWSSKSLGEICRFQAGDAFAKDEQGRSSGDHPFIKVSDMNLAGNELYISRANNWVSHEEAHREYRLHPKDAVVFAKIGIALTYNRRRRLTRETVIDNNMMSAVCVAGIDFTWFYYLLSTIDFNLISSGSALPYLTVKDLSRIPVEVPPLRYQQAIASILGALDDKIDINRRMNETLEAMARVTFKDWFVDFGPTRAKMEGRASYLSPEIWSLFPDLLDNEGKPQGWERIVLRDAADVLSGGTPAKDCADFWNGPIPWISPKVMTAIHVSDSEDRVTPQAIGHGTRLAPPGSVLVMVRGMGLHQGVRISQARCDVAFNQDVKALVPQRLSGTHLLFGMLDAAPYLFSKVEASGHGTGKLPTDVVDSVDFITPTGGAYNQLIPALDALNDRIAANNAESITLTALRDLLLPMLMSGRTRVKDAEKIAEAAQ